jgi:predicted RNA binding protein YcfA (HicA-like mRNA interferase family)
MSKQLPAAKPREVIRALEKAGWKVHRQKGSHVSMHKEGAPNIVVVPLHTRDLPKGTLHGILEDAGLTIEEFLKLL